MPERLKPERLKMTAQVAINEITILGGSIRISYDLWTTGDDPSKLNDKPIVREINHGEIVALKAPGVEAEMKTKKKGADETYEDAQHRIEATDNFFVSRRELVAEIDAIVQAIVTQS